MSYQAPSGKCASRSGASDLSAFFPHPFTRENRPIAPRRSPLQSEVGILLATGKEISKRLTNSFVTGDSQIRTKYGGTLPRLRPLAPLHPLDGRRGGGGGARQWWGTRGGEARHLEGSLCIAIPARRGPFGARGAGPHTGPG